MPYIAAQLKERNLPPELIVLPLVESTYNPFAYSSRNAAGLWQFMRPTAKYLGIQQNWWYDGRRDTIASTDAALRYLTYLHDRFSGDWLLALAAYNSGEGTLKKAIRSNHARGLPTDYWTLNLPSETRAYVPRFLAMTKILSKPERYGLKLPELYEEINFDLIKLGERIDLIQAALLANISAEEFYKLNPGFLRTTSPPHGPFIILLPKGTESGFRARLAASPKSSWQPAQRHIVQPGDTLSEIAESYHLTMKSLVYTNKLRSTGIREGQILKIPTGISTNQSALPAFVNAQHRYRVRQGDTLSGIAAKHRISTSALAQWNKWPLSKLLIPGQKLVLYPHS